MTDTATPPVQLRRIVVGFDFGEPSLVACRWIARHFAPGAELVLVHAVDVPEPPRFLRGRYPPLEELRANAERGAQMRMRELGPAVGAQRMWTEIRIGRPAECVARVAEEMSADLIVVGSHGERPGIWKLLGSTAHHLLEASRIPVLLARGLPSSPPRRLIAPIDDSASAARALAWAAELARRHDGEAIAFHVVHPALLGAIAMGGSPTERRRAEEMLEEESRRWATDLVSEIAPAKESVRIEIVQGDPGFEILAAARRLDADLIVMGRRGAGGTRMVLGSVTDFVLRSGATSVLVVSDEEPASR